METLTNVAACTLQQGRAVVLWDDISLRPAGYLVAAAEQASTELVCQFVNYGRGVIAAAMVETRLAELGLPMMAPTATTTSTSSSTSSSTSQRAGILAEFAVSVDARHGITTGISAAERAATLRVLATTREPHLDLVMPGHIVPWRAKTGGILVRSGVAEGAVDLLRIAGITPVAAVVQCLDELGELSDRPTCQQLATELGVPLLELSQILQAKIAEQSIIEKIAESVLPTEHAGTFRALVFRSKNDDAEHLALLKGDIDLKDADGEQLPLLVRVQSEHLLGDLLGTDGFSSRQLVAGALDAIHAEGRGIFVYVRHRRQGAIESQVRNLFGGESAQASSTAGNSTVREYGIGAQILSYLGARRIVLLTNSQRSIPGLDTYKLTIVGRRVFAPRVRNVNNHQVCP